jgi:RNA polymerase sigma-70 factor (ECF subfamily)
VTGRTAGEPVTGPSQEPESSERALTPDNALRLLYEAHGAVLLSYLMRLTKGDRHRAEDLLQETLMRAWRHPEARQAGGEWSRPWLFTVARRIAIDQMRAGLTRPTELGDDRLDERAQVDEGFDRIADRAEIREALLALPDRLRTVIVEIYFRDRSVTEVAEILGVPPGTIKSRTFYALRALREQLAERGFLRPPTA